jgi:hypothetical protein
MNDLSRSLLILLLATPLFAAASRADAATIDFDALGDGEVVTTQFAGLTFANAMILTAGISLNEFEFPPRSESNVVFDNGGAISIAFSAPQASVGGFVTYVTPVTLTAFGTSGDTLGVATSTFGSNLALSGDAGSSPNELLTLAFASGIARVAIQGDATGGSFALDDLTFQPAATTAVSEPSSLAITVVGVMAIIALGWRRFFGRHTGSRLARW